MLSVKTVRFAEYLSCLDGCQYLIKFEDIRNLIKDIYQTPTAVNIIIFISREGLPRVNFYLSIGYDNE